MAIKITREEYEKKFGVQPGAPTPVQPTPITPQAQPKQKSLLGKYVDLNKNAAIGMAKGAVETLQNVGNLVAKPLNKILPGPEQKIGISEETLKPKNATQAIGKGIERVAEFALPVGSVSKVGQVPKAASLTQKAIGLGKRALTEGVVGGGVTAAQEGGVDRETRDVALLSSLFPVAGKVLKSSSQILRNPKNGSRVINSLIKPLMKDLRYGKNPGRVIAEEGIIANNFDELVNKISIRKDQIGQQIEQLLSTPESKNIKIDIEDALNPLNEAYTRALQAPNSNSAVLQRIKGTIDDILGKSTDEKGKVTMARRLTGLNPLEVTQMKRLIGDITKFTGNQSDDKIVNKALKQSYGLLKAKIEKAVPTIKPLNEKYADLTSAKIAGEYRDKILERQNMVSFGGKVVGGTSALVTAIASGGAAVPAIVAGMGGVALEKALATPAVKTRFARWLASASPEEKKQLIQKAPWIKAVIASAYGRRESNQSQ